MEAGICRVGRAAGLDRGHQMELNHRPIYSLAGYSCREGLRYYCLNVSAALKVATPSFAFCLSWVSFFLLVLKHFPAGERLRSPQGLSLLLISAVSRSLSCLYSVPQPWPVLWGCRRQFGAESVAFPPVGCYPAEQSLAAPHGPQTRCCVAVI